MFKNMKDFGIAEDRRGMIGIGTLIVFIAMVIVAAVAAGVLINTSGTLQQQARATGEETIAEVSSGIKVLATKGYTNNDNKIDNIQVIVRPYAGTQGINLENTVIQYKSDYEMDHLTYSSDGASGDNDYFGVVGIQDASGTGETMLEQMGDIAKIVIELDDNTLPTETSSDNTDKAGQNEAVDTSLNTSESASITLIPNAGFQSYYGILIPATLKQTNWYEL